MGKSITDIQGTFKLNNGINMPYLGLGVFQSERVTNAVIHAIETGYRHIDTAAIYNNEVEVGEAIRQSGIDRSEIFLVSKVWNTDQGYNSTFKAYENSLNRLKVDYLDLYLIHWPVKNKFIETWTALEELYKKGKIRAIGVSNFLKHHLDELLPNSSIIPMVNQMEFHPYLVQQDLIDFCAKKGIQYEAWSPLMKGKIIDIELLKNIALKYSKTTAQVVLRWEIQKGVITIPKSSNPNRIVENADLFDFELSTEDMRLIDRLDRNYRVGPDPNNFAF